MTRIELGTSHTESRHSTCIFCYYHDLCCIVATLQHCMRSIILYSTHAIEDIISTDIKYLTIGEKSDENGQL